MIDNLICPRFKINHIQPNLVADPSNFMPNLGLILVSFFVSCYIEPMFLPILLPIFEPITAALIIFLCTLISTWVLYIGAIPLWTSFSSWMEGILKSFNRHLSRWIYAIYHLGADPLWVGTVIFLLLGLFLLTLGPFLDNVLQNLMGWTDPETILQPFRDRGRNTESNLQVYQRGDPRTKVEYFTGTSYKLDQS